MVHKNIILLKKNREKGVALLVMFFIMGIALTVVLGVTVILISEIKIIRGMGYSVVAFYTADTGMEEFLYLDKKKIPTDGTRGFCDICNSCQDFGCEPSSCVATGDDCDLITCTDCQISYCTGAGCTGTGDKKYNVMASITPTEESFKSFGTYQKTTRAIELNFVTGGVYNTGSQPPMIYNTSVVPRSREFGLELEIVADVYDSDGVASAEIHIQYPDETDIAVKNFPVYSGITYKTTWTGPVGFYYVDITACDTKGHCSEKENI